MAETKTCILIAGMHRCGTSAVAGCFQLLGYHTGVTMMPPSIDNPKGYFENTKCWQLNERMLSMLELKWDSIRKSKRDHVYMKDKVYYHEIDKIISEEFHFSHDILIKDPRLSYLLPYWIERLKFHNYNVKIILPYRLPQKVCKSLHQRDGFSVEKGAFLYSRYLLQGILYSLKEDVTVVDLKDLRKDCLQAIRTINDDLGLITPVRIDSIGSTLTSFVSPEISSNNSNELYKEITPPFSQSVYQLFKEIRESNVVDNEIGTKAEELFANLESLISIKSFIDEEYNELYSFQEEGDNQIDYLNELVGELKDKYKSITEDINSNLLSNNLLHYNNIQKELVKVREEIQQHKILETQLKEIKQLLPQSKKIESDLSHIKQLLPQSKKIESDLRHIKQLLPQTSIFDTGVEEIKESLSQLVISQEKDKESSASLMKTQLHDFQNRLNIYTHEYNRLSIDYNNLKSSISNRLGFTITWPLRKVYSLSLFIITIFRWIWTYFSLVIREKEAAKDYLTFDNLKKLFYSLKTEPAQNVFSNVSRTLRDKSGVLAPQNIETVLDGEVGEYPILCHVDEAIIKEEFIFVRGWALSKAGINKVELIHEGKVYPMIYEFERQDLGLAYPEYKNSDKGGFFLFDKIEKGSSDALTKVYDNNNAYVELNTIFEKVESFDHVTQQMNMGYLKTELQYPIWSLINKSKEKAEITLSYKPLISVIIPIYNIEKIWLDKCIQSVVDQTYDNWELCIYDDASSNKETIQALKQWENEDSRIHILYGEENRHISYASNRALSIAKGEYIALLDHDDVLYCRALYEVVNELNKNRHADVVYSDEDKIDKTGMHIEPHFKPDWSPETLQNMMYLGHLLVIRKTIIDQVGGFRMGYEGSQDYDLMLRISEITQHFLHIPKVLYHWRIVGTSVAGGADNKMYAYDAAQRAISSHLKKLNQSATVSTSEFTGLYTVKRAPKGGKVVIIIPFHNAAQMTIECIATILDSSYDDLEIVLVSNNSSKEEFDQVKFYIATLDNIKLYQYNIPFNYSAINNWAVTKIEADFLLFLNNDIKVISKDWIERMMEHAENPEIGAVGAKLLYEDDTIQHAGVVMRIGGVAAHGFRHIPDDEPGYCGYAAVYRNCAAVTGACLMIRKEAFDAVGGFNEQHLHVAYNDIDLCLKLLSKGYRNIYTPHAKLYHLESKTRPKTIFDMSREELEQYNYESDYMKKTYPDIFSFGDPYYNVNLTLKHENYSLNL